jgi:hypothetical protein
MLTQVSKLNANEILQEIRALLPSDIKRLCKFVR